MHSLCPQNFSFCHSNCFARPTAQRVIVALVLCMASSPATRAVLAFEPSSWKPTGCWSARQVKHSPSCRQRRHAHHKCKKHPLCGLLCEAIGMAKRGYLRTKTMHSSLHSRFQMFARSPHVGFFMQFCTVVRHAEFIA